MVLKYHPDLNPGDKEAEEKTKRINEAHDVLRDDEKRKFYDQYGSDWLRHWRRRVSLSKLTLSDGTNLVPLDSVFAAATTNYSANVASAVASVKVTPTANHQSASVTVDGVHIRSGSTSPAIPLTVGVPRAISVVVTAQDGATRRTYTITVTRQRSSDADLSGLTLSDGTLRPVFHPANTDYEASVNYAVAFVRVTPTVKDQSSTVTVEGVRVRSGLVSRAIPLTEGASKAIRVVVTAQEGVATKTYTIIVTRQRSPGASLKRLTLYDGTNLVSLNPGFNTATTDYAASVPNPVTSVRVIPTVSDQGATVAVEGIGVSSSLVSRAIPLTEGASKVIRVSLPSIFEPGLPKNFEPP